MTNEQKLKPCPCGKTPTALDVSDAGQGGKWANVQGNCCGEWTIEFRTMSHPLESAECMALAVASWNEAPRAEPSQHSAEVEGLNRIIADLQHEEDVSVLTIELMQNILERICETLKGPRPKNGAHSFADLPGMVEALMVELHEQARLLGMSGEREARLLARIAELEKAL